jgi:structural maintenance of chromosome 3 (chondroitin sulfate proteoglycan 6)
MGNGTADEEAACGEREPQEVAHVNKKAFEQYSNITKQRDQLLKRPEDLDNLAGSIEELVEVFGPAKYK